MFSINFSHFDSDLVSKCDNGLPVNLGCTCTSVCVNR